MFEFLHQVFDASTELTTGHRVIVRQSLQAVSFEQMALKQFAKMEEKLREEHGIYHLAIDHRKGIVPVGGISVVIAVSAPHRKAALAACADAIEILKADVPIWKKEVYPDGHEWRQGS